MLSTVRKSVSGPGAYVLIGLVILAFAFVGLPALSGLGNNDAVRVGDEGYGLTEVEREFNRRLQNERRSGNTDITRDQAIAQGLLAQTVNYFTLRGLVDSEADRLGLAVTDEMIQDALREDEVFQNPQTGQFDPSRLDRILSAEGLGYEEFRDRMRTELLKEQLDAALLTIVPAPEAAATYLTLRQAEVRTVTLATLDAGTAETPDEAALETYYEDNIARYQSPERRRYVVLTLTPDSLRARTEIDEAEVEARYDELRDSLGTPATRTFTQAQVADEATADALIAAVENGTAFTEAAAQVGASVASFETAQRGQISDTAVRDAVFAQDAPGLVGPIDGLFGTVVANVTAATEAATPSLADARAEIEDILFEEIYIDELDRVYDALQDAGDAGRTLADVADSLGLDVQTVGPVDADMMIEGGAIENVDADVHRAAFAMTEDMGFTEVPLGEGRYAFVEIAEVIPTAPRPLADVREEVSADYVASRRAEAADRVIGEVREALAQGSTLEDAAAARGQSAATRRISAANPPETVPQNVLAEIFSAPIGDVLTVATPTGTNVVVARVDGVAFEGSSQTAAAATRLRQQLTQQYGQDLYEAYLGALETEFEVRTDDSAIASRFGITP